MSFENESLPEDPFDDWVASSNVRRVIDNALHNVDDGELYLQFSQFSNISLRDGRIVNANANTGVGFGLRAVKGDLVGYAHSNELSRDALSRAVGAVSVVNNGATGEWDVSPDRNNIKLYTDENLVDLIPIKAKIDLLNKIDAYARRADARVVQVNADVSASWEVIEILRPGNERYSDIRPLVRLIVSVYMTHKGRTEMGESSAGGRYSIKELLEDEFWKGHVDDAIRQSDVNLQSVPAPAGEMTVVLGAGWPGVMLHEAVGHGLEGDAVRKGDSVYSKLLGQQVAAKGVTIVDDGTLPRKRGSLTIDDEGTPTTKTVLIEDGVLKGFMHDRMSARLMGETPTGNGRRESYAHVCMPRMTNTYMLNGQHHSQEVIESVDEGVYAVSFSGGQVDITSGDFVFSCTEAYRIRRGKVLEPIKGATLIGNGPEAMRKVTMVGNDMALDNGIATCGKSGQSVPVGVGQPTLRMNSITVGGTAA